jgi:hypothetical protein
VVPPQLELDLFEEKAYVGIFPFVVHRLRPPFLPPIPWISTFPETNLRTYVRARDGSCGVWFFSLDADRLIDVVAARSVYGLPYRSVYGLPYMWSAMRRQAMGKARRYEHVRRWPGPPAHSKVVVETGALIPAEEATELDLFLLARWRLYTLIRNRVHYVQVEHEPWPLHRARLLELDQSLFRAAGLPQPSGEPHLLYSPGVNARVTFPRRLLT